MKRLLYLATISLLLVGCNKEQQDPQNDDDLYGVECADYNYVDESGQPTKSVIGLDETSDGSQKITNWNIWVYKHSNGQLANSGHTYFSTASGIKGSLLFPDKSLAYDIYILTNVGQITAPATATAAADYSYTFQDYNSFKPENDGFPMANKYLNFIPNNATSKTFIANRLVSKYNVTIVNDIDNADFNLKSVSLMQAAKFITPFKETSLISSASQADNNMDAFSSSELVKKANGTYEGVLFMLENNQGTVFKSSATSDKYRVPENMVNPQKHEDICTYLEFKGDIIQKDGQAQTGATFRHYFGSGTQAGVSRNVNTPLTLTLKDTPTVEEWRIIPGEPSDTRRVVFQEHYNEPYICELELLGAEYEIDVEPKAGTQFNEYIEYKLECNDAVAGALTFDGVTLGILVNGKQTLKVKTGYTGLDRKMIELKATASDGKDLGSMFFELDKPMRICSQGATVQQPVLPSDDDDPDEWTSILTNGKVDFWTELHEWDTQFGSTEVHRVRCSRIGYLDENDEFHEFEHYTIGTKPYSYWQDVKDRALYSNTYSDNYFSWSNGYKGSASMEIVVSETKPLKKPQDAINKIRYSISFTGTCSKIDLLRP